MPIAGVVITGRGEDTRELLKVLDDLPGIDVHGHDVSGNIVAVLDTSSSEEMERLIEAVNRDARVLNVGLTYLNTEDEAVKLADGERLPRPFGFKQPLN